MSDPFPWLQAVSLGVGAIVMAIVVCRVMLRSRRSSNDLKADGGEALVDMAFIDQLAAAAPPERVSELFVAMAQDCRACIDDIRSAAKLSDFDRIQEECASLADSCDAFGAKGLAGHARALRIAIQDRAFTDAGRLMVEIDRVVEQTFRAINYRLKKDGRRRFRVLR